MRDDLAAEWLKIRTARSTRIIVGVVVVLTVLMAALAVYFVATWDALSPEQRARSSLGALPDLLGWILSLCMAVFGTLAIASEYSNGMIRTTFIAMPRRGRVVLAKAVVVGVVAFVVAELALVATVLSSAAVVGDRAISGQTPPDAGTVVLVVAMGLSTATFALVGLALGAITRSALASVVALALLWYIVPLVARFAPEPIDDWLTSMVPGALAGQLAGTGNANSVFGAVLSPSAALIVMLAYALIPVGIAMFAVDRRDA